jgi:anti-sigma factor RsiW
MSCCEKNRERLTWLALNSLEAGEAAELRTHLETCPECQRYFKEMANVTDNLKRSSPAISELEASNEFHRRLKHRITTEQPSWILERLHSLLHSLKMNWRWIAPAMGMALVIMAVLLPMKPANELKLAARTAKPVVSNPPLKSEPASTLGSYRLLANRSLDALDAKLTSEAETSSSSAYAAPTPRMADMFAAKFP